MDKLIITIISIALTAATLTVGGSYLSNYQTRAQAKVQATTWLAEAAQIATAAKQAGNLASSSDDFSTGTASFLRPNYLTDLPKRGGSYVFSAAQLNGTTFTYPYYDTDANLIMTSVENANVCEEIQRRGNRGSTNLTRYPSAANLQSNFHSSFTINQDLTCVWLDANNNSIYDPAGTDDYFFITRVFRDR